MAFTAKIQPIERDIEVILKQGLSPEEQGKVFAQFAREKIEEVKKDNARVLGHVPSYTVTVDGRIGASLDSAKVPGTIVVEFEIVTEALIWIDQQIEIHSPIKSGRFRKSNILLADGVLIDVRQSVAQSAEEYVFINSQPYARKIESGKSSQAPDGVYQAVATLAGTRFGANVAKITFGYRSLVTGAVHDWAQTKSAARHASKFRRHGIGASEWLRRQPAVIVRIRH